MKVTIEIPDREWWRFTGIAERRGMDLPDLIGDAILAEIRRPYIAAIDEGTAQREALVEYLVDRGLTDAVIAERLGVPHHFVVTARRRAGLKANRQRRTAGVRRTR